MNRLLKSNAGFTVIELIIVIVILGILAGLGVPALMSSVQNSRVKTTIANAQMISRAVNQYYAENNNIYPTSAQLDTRLNKPTSAMGFTYNQPAANTTLQFTLTLDPANSAVGLANNGTAFVVGTGGVTASTATSVTFTFNVQ